MFPQEVKKHYASKSAPAEPKQEKVEVPAPPAEKAEAPLPAGPIDTSFMRNPREVKLTINGNDYTARVEEIPLDK